MNDKYKPLFPGIGIVLLSLTNCKKFVEIPPPVTQIATASVFSSDASATSAQLAIYTQMQGDPANMDRITGLSSDEFVTSASDQTSKDIYTNTLSTIDASSSINEWAQAYKYIYEENAVYQQVNNTGLVSLRVKQQLLGEAEFLRAFWYFYLINLYGDVPLVTSTNYQVNSNLSRTSSSLVYQQCIGDLKNAQSLLSANYLDATDTTITKDRARPTSWAATALLARIYLYTEHYDSAEAEATIVINNASQYLLCNQLDSVFLKNNTEAIWQIIPSPASGYTQEGLTFVLMTTPGPGLSGSTTLSSQLFNAFESNDLRKIHWIGKISSGTNSWYFANKYKSGSGTPAPAKEYSTILRLGEQYLIRAEARIQQGNISEGLQDLNVIRNRAGLSNYSGAMDQQSIVSAIIHERQVELFGECHRWLDLKRVGILNAVMGGANGVCQAKGGNWVSTQYLYPIPATDIQNDPNLSQTPGY